MNTSLAAFLISVSVVLIVAVIGGLCYLCYLQAMEWRERYRMHKVQKDIQKEFNNAYNAMLDEAWRCSNQNNRWW